MDVNMDLNNIKYSVVFCYIALLYCGVVVDCGTTEIKEYCQIDTFNPSCADNEVIIIIHGMFGRMKTGHCVKIADNLGCSTDVRGFLNTKCSGKKSCSILINELIREAKLTCLREMNAYLEASFKCQTVFTPSSRHCSSPVVIEAASRSQFLSSVISKDSSCGLHQTPYILEAKPGQILDISMHDFSADSSVSAESCVKYGYILDTKDDDVINLCGGIEERKHVLKSSGNNIQILLERSAISSHYFLIEFKASGCPDITPPKYAWLQRTNTTVTIGCQTSADKWTMKCIGNIWLGIMRNCSAPKPVLKPTSETPKVHPNKDQVSNSIPHVTDKHLFAIGIGCITIIICVTTVVLGIHCVKRYELSVQKKNSFNMNTLSHGTTYRPVNITSGTLPSFSVNTALPAYTLNRDENAPELPRRTASIGMPAMENNSAADYFNLINMDQRHNHEKIYQSIPREGPLLG